MIKPENFKDFRIFQFGKKNTTPLHLKKQGFDIFFVIRIESHCSVVLLLRFFSVLCVVFIYIFVEFTTKVLKILFL